MDPICQQGSVQAAHGFITVWSAAHADRLGSLVCLKMLSTIDYYIAMFNNYLQPFMHSTYQNNDEMLQQNYQVQVVEYSGQF